MNSKRIWLLLVLIVVGLAAACEPADVPNGSAPATAQVSAPIVAPAATATASVSEPGATATDGAGVAALPTTTATVAVAEPTDGPLSSATPLVEVTPVTLSYVTPPQQEGPYYPLEKPADRDNDLVALAGAAAAPNGEVLALSGVVYDRNGLPVEGATVEIWQTDSSGVYMHPGDPGTEGRDRNFQFYGESVTGADGVYSFRTIIPGRYEPRPRHIHVKVRRDGQELLTTQFYFGNEISLSGDEAQLLIEMAQAEDDAGHPIWVGQRNIVLDVAG